MAYKQEYIFNTISDYHKVMGLDPPGHPQLSVINFKIDRFSHDLICTHLELLIKYADKYYNSAGEGKIGFR